MHREALNFASSVSCGHGRFAKDVWTSAVHFKTPHTGPMRLKVSISFQIVGGANQQAAWQRSTPDPRRDLAYVARSEIPARWRHSISSMKSDPTDTCLNCCLLPSTYMIRCTSCCQRELGVRSCCSGRNTDSIHHSSAIPRRYGLFTAGTDLQIWGYRDSGASFSDSRRRFSSAA